MRPTIHLTTFCALLYFALGAQPAAHAAIYHVSPDGDDSQSGLSPKRAWRTAARVNAFKFSGGDQILFEGGRTFAGPVKLDHEDSGNAEEAVVVGSYRMKEAGRAVINAGRGRGIEIHNASGIRITGLKIVGSGPKDNLDSGIVLLSSLDAGAQDIAVEDVEISGFGQHGISIGSWKTNTGYRNVRMTRCSSHDNRRTGIVSWGPWGAGIYAHQDISIHDSHAYNMKGGSGIVLSSVDGGIVERCIAYENGSEYSGGAGIWAWDSTNIVFQYNESHNNRTIGVDGDGFDFDGGVTNSVMQYNYSHDNDAAGYLLAQYSCAPQAMQNIVIRYNISENDCRKKGYGAIHVWNGDGADRVRDIHIYQNTIYLAATGTEKMKPYSPSVFARVSESLGRNPIPRYHPSAIAVISPTTSVSVYNNIFFTTGGGTLVSVVPGQETIRFQSNAYWTDTGRFTVEWMGTRHHSLAAWLQAAEDQERIGTRILAVHEDPMLVAPGTGGTLGNADLLQTLTGYKLRQGSPLAGRGLDLLGVFGIDPGNHGFFGTPILPRGPRAIGANLALAIHENEPGQDAVNGEAFPSGPQ